MTGTDGPRLLGVDNEPVLEVAPVDRLSIGVVTGSGRGLGVEFRFRRDFVEVWTPGHCCAVVDRDALREWISAQSRTPLVVDEVAFSVDRMVDHDGRVAISLPDVQVWTLSAFDLANLRDRL